MPRSRALATALTACLLAGCAIADPAQQQPPQPSDAPVSAASPSLADGAPATSPSPHSDAPSAPASTPSAASTASVAAASPSPTPELPPELDGLVLPLAQRFHAAQLAAADAGLTLTLTSGYRDPVFQQQIFDAKVAGTGSVAEASKWVLAPEKSAHCQGQAIDVGPTITEMTWLETNQAAFGLCRRYANEPWHFELAQADGTCPPMLESAATG